MWVHGTDFAEYARTHAKTIALIVTIVVVVLTTIIVLSIVLPKKKERHQHPSTSPFNGPPTINGDVSNASSDEFGTPQIIENSNTQDTLFGSQLFVHQAGYICAVSNTNDGSQALQFYQTELDNGGISFQQRIELSTILPASYIVCTGYFAPIFNVINEVYYLFLSVGVNSNHPSTSGNKNPKVGITNYALNVVIFYLDTSQSSLLWTVGNVVAEDKLICNMTTTGCADQASSSIRVLKLPNNNFTWSGTIPAYGTFGDKIQVVLDDNTSIIKQSVYIRGSEYDPLQPGGIIYWYVLTDNSTNPTIQLIAQIQDARLLQVQNCLLSPNSFFPPCISSNAPGSSLGPTTSPCPPPDLTPGSKAPELYINDFGFDFYVTSGLGSNNILLVANNTSEDNCNTNYSDTQAAAINGYIQGYLWEKDTNLGWTQSGSSSTSSIFKYRFPADTPGFGTGLLWANDTVITGVAGPASNGGATYLVLPWSNSGITTTTNAQGVTSLIVEQSITPTTPSSPFLITPLYNGTPSAPSQTRNITLAALPDQKEFLFTTWYDQGGSNTLTIQNSPTVSPTTTNQNLGKDFITGNPIIPPTTKIGGSQSTAVWLSRTGLTIRLITNDPYFNNQSGRFIVWSKART